MNSFFEKEIFVANGVDPEVDSNGQVSTPSLLFFPEGGQLVQSLDNKVAFKVSGSDGRGIDAIGYLFNDKGDTMSVISTYKNGLGSFLVKPRKGRSYYVSLICGGDTTLHRLPEPSEWGVNLLTDMTKGEEGTIAIQSSRKFIGENSRLFVLIHSRGIVQFAATAGVSAKYELTIPRSKLADGVNHMTVFDESGKPLLERLIFKTPTGEAPVSIAGISRSYRRRDQVNAMLNSRIDEEASLTISVHDRQPVSDQNIRNYLLLTSDLNGYIENPSFYFQQSDSAATAADLLMLTHGWTKYTWEHVLNYDTLSFDYYAEKEGQILRGKLVNIASKEVLKDTMLLLSSYNQQPNFVFLRPRQNGEFICALPELYDSDVLSLTPSVRGNPKGYKLEILSTFEKAFQYTPRFQYSNAMKEGLFTERRIIENYRLHDAATFGLPVKEQEEDIFSRAQTMGETKYELFPADYVQLNDVSEMVFELLPSVKIKKKKGDDMFYVLDEATAVSYTDNVSYEYKVYEQNKEPATVFIDGVPILDHSVALDLDYQDIHKVEVFNKKEFPGLDKVFHGAISFTTKDFVAEDRLFRTLNSNEVRFDGFSLKREFYSPTDSEVALMDTRKPDLRHLLYWSDNTLIKAWESLPFKFHTSIVEGEFYIKVEGITESGKPIFEVQKFSVQR